MDVQYGNRGTRKALYSSSRPSTSELKAKIKGRYRAAERSIPEVAQVEIDAGKHPSLTTDERQGALLLHQEHNAAQADVGLLQATDGFLCEGNVVKRHSFNEREQVTAHSLFKESKDILGLSQVQLELYNKRRAMNSTDSRARGSGNL
jgi:hypothetical protein